MNKLLIFLDWDSDFFGYKIGKIYIEKKISSASLVEAFHEAKLNGFDLIYLSLPHDDEELNAIAQKFFAKLVDKKTTFFIKLNKDQIFALHRNVVQYQNKEANEELLDLSVQIGIYSRFNKDEKFTHLQFEKLYKLWMIRSVKKELSKEVLVYKDNLSIKGVITLDIRNNIGMIGLMGVDRKCRGQNIGFELINASKKYFLEQDITIIEVLTQGFNIAACNLYKKCGFDILAIKNFYHLWFV